MVPASFCPVIVSKEELSNKPCLGDHVDSGTTDTPEILPLLPCG